MIGIKHIVISVASIIGVDLRPRSFFRRDIERVSQPLDHNIVLDFTAVQFISRSVADELCEILSEYPQIEVTGTFGDVKKMFDVVLNSRNSPREYSGNEATVFHLQNQKDMEAFFSTF